MNYQLNQIYRNHESNYYLVVSVNSRYLQLKNIGTGCIINPSTNSVFLDYCTLIGTTDSHPELLI